MVIGNMSCVFISCQLLSRLILALSDQLLGVVRFV